MTPDDEKIMKELADVIVNARPLAADLSAALDGHDMPDCIAALGIALAAVLHGEREESRKMSKYFCDIAYNTALMSFDRKARAQ